MEETINVEVREPQVALVTRVVARVVDIPRKLAEIIPAVVKLVNQRDMPVVGPPLARYFVFTPDSTDFEAGVPIVEAIPVDEGEYRCVIHPGGPAVTTWHLGSHEKIGDTYEQLQKWMVLHHREPRDAPVEHYWTNPKMEKDPARFRTLIYWPIT